MSDPAGYVRVGAAYAGWSLHLPGCRERALGLVAEDEWCAGKESLRLPAQTHETTCGRSGRCHDGATRGQRVLPKMVGAAMPAQQLLFRAAAAASTAVTAKGISTNQERGHP